MAKQPRLINPDCHRPVPWNERAVERALAASGHLLVQVKEDGIRIHAFIDNTGDVYVVTREGIEIRSLAVVKEQLRSVLEQLPDGFCVDGEAVVQGVPFEVGSGLLRAYAEIEEEVVFHLWDAFPLKALIGEEYAVPYSDRLNTLVAAWCQTASDKWRSDTVEIVAGEMVTSMQEIMQYFEDCRGVGKEGAVVKSPDLPLIHGKRTGQWKLKPSDNADGRVVGLVWGTPGLGNAGKIIGFTVELESGVLCDVTGITQAQMDLFTQQVNDAYVNADRKSPHMGRYVEIAYMEMTAAGSLRHPSFVQFRDLEYAPGWKS
jgi:ATP-dependent DNA ligase